MLCGRMNAKKAQATLEAIILFCGLLGFCSVMVIEKNSLEQKIVEKTSLLSDKGAENASCSFGESAALSENIALDLGYGVRVGECSNAKGFDTIVVGEK